METQTYAWLQSVPELRQWVEGKVLAGRCRASIQVAFEQLADGSWQARTTSGMDELGGDITVTGHVSRELAQKAMEDALWDCLKRVGNQ